MNIETLKNKIKLYKDELYNDVENFVKENAKYKVGDVVKSGMNNGDVYFVVTQVGFQYGNIVYFGHKITKKTGDVSFMDMDYNVGTYERSITKETLKIKDKEISTIEKSIYFKYDINIKLNT